MVPILISCSAANVSSSVRRAMVPSSYITSQITPLGSKPAMRARSQAASVWPARARVPPGWAISGKMWPGLTMSSALASLAAAACTVRARSAAEMPVVTPVVASIDTVNLVPKPEPLRGAINGSFSSSQRSRLIGMQIRPRACLAMKLMCSGLQHSAAMIRSPSFSRSSSSMRMTILPWRISSTSSSMLLSATRHPLESGFEVAVGGQKAFGDVSGFCRLCGLIAQQQALQITCQQVHFQIHPATWLVRRHDGFAQGVGNDRQQELGAIDCVHGQAGAIDGDRAFMGDVLGEVFRRADAEFHCASIFCTGNHFAHAIDVTADQVPTQTCGRGQGFFQVDRAAAFQVVHGGAVEGFAADVCRKAIAWQFNCGQAYAVDRDAVAQFDVAQVELAGFYVYPHISAFWGQCTNTADGFDDAGKHGVLLENKAVAWRKPGIIRSLLAQVWR